MHDKHRRLFVLSGESEWARASAAELLLAFQRRLWIGETPPIDAESLPAAKARHWLGSDRDAVVFDAFHGFDPDAFGAVAGTIVGGGILVLLVPHLARWADYHDPDKARIATYPHGTDAVTGRFLQRLVDVVRTHPAVSLIAQERNATTASIRDIQLSSTAPVNTAFELTPDQHHAAEAILKAAEGHARRPLVIMSDRGRGKSTALGIAAAQLLQRGRQRILITAPGINSAETLLQHAQHHLPDALRDGHTIHGDGGTIDFIPPDELLRGAHTADLLLVDEAAAIPTPLLEKLLKRFNRIAFATTEHGYEGAGRGFTLKFMQILQHQTPHWRRLHLQTPVRWSANDPVEAFVFKTLLLDAEAADAEQITDSDKYRIIQLDRNRLASDEQTLSELFGLLILAHYQTRPSDLRNLLDGPDLSIWAVTCNGHVAAALLAITEGNLDTELSEQIALGKRRPRGHMLPQTLTAHAGFPDAATMRYCRVMRIAVHPAILGRGVGTNLLRAVIDHGRQQGLDFIGSSFGATPELIGFWRKSEMSPVRIGVSRDAASGCHSVVVLKPLSDNGLKLFKQMHHRFIAALPYQLADPLRELEAEVALSLFDSNHVPWAVDALDLQDLDAFAHGRRDYAGARLALWRLTCRTAASSAARSLMVPLILKVLQGHDWPTCALLLQLSGRKAVERQLRKAVEVLLTEGYIPLSR